IDFLLLAHGHGCEDSEGMCCMNLTDHSQSIRKSISILMDRRKNLEIDEGFFGLENLLNS
ncbi:hypothetical protein N303_01657, partial [Cuculus canorus]